MEKVIRDGKVPFNFEIKKLREDLGAERIFNLKTK